MVVDELPCEDEQTDLLFHALADATRRDIVRRVLVQEASVSALAAHYAMSFAAVQKHVAVLERAHLVVKQRRGREQIVHGHVDALRRAARLLAALEELWRGRADRMAAVLAELDPDGGTPPDAPAPPAAPDGVPA
ncbi:ArsR/SmtB family transcription factor [Cellulomonas shaoxiangyii]|uniref:ArsR family transcriptional regulator n=1 Tax=Cellulomonas shaoxiangyii TaxID=2566013 RepID=A0A4P7SJ71_9CELL|nr:metalloregulator ArsR/SmtB family transcription factor [Cellulomonas shaoxiangyii]QCB94130.1 ArsR family transcriptional regulator [Cellulomonas shaoxiangyii]TGY86623.1 ArsR family transcriptional regulator [Cellulomonas shaoxiangyii]